nr:hypothetical protein [uncultured Mucilaginibacter sp.]
MKKTLLIVAFVAGLAACKKEKTPALFNIVGKWELRYTTGGGLAAAPAASVYIYEFKADSTFVQYIDNAVHATGQYHTAITNRTAANTYGRIEISGNGSDSFKLNKDTLLLGVNNATGISHTYVKK